MKLSKAGIKPVRIKKEEIDEMYPVQDILLKSGQLVQYGGGIYGINNIPKKLKENIERSIIRGLDRHDAIQVELPIVQPDSIWEMSGRLDKYLEEDSMLTMDTKKGRLVLAPTAEEAAVCFGKEQLDSYKRLPATFYQIGDKYRNEMRTRGYLLRAKSFVMMDAYSFDKDEQGMRESYQNMRKAYLEIFKQMGLEPIPVAADSGAIGGSKSEEFMILSPIGEDTILFDRKTGKGINIEIIDRPEYKEYLQEKYGVETVGALSTQKLMELIQTPMYATYLQKEQGIENVGDLEARKAMELGHIFQLGTKYSVPMEGQFMNQNQQKSPYWMGCYGIGVSRTLGLVYERSLVRDERGNIGIALPVNLAPYTIQIVANGEEQQKRANALYEVLQNRGVETILDDREGSLGSKIKDCKLLGTPYIAILGSRTKENEVEVEDSRTGEKYIVGAANLVRSLEKLEQARHSNSDAKLTDYIREVERNKEEKISPKKEDAEGR